MSDKLEDPQYPHDPHQSDHLTSLADDLKVLQTLQQERQVEWYDCKQINQIHWTFHELELLRTDDQSEEKKFKDRF